MATDNKTNLQIVGLDFDEIVNNLKDYLKTQDTFTDFDFEGSAMSALIKVCAYYGHYMGVYANFSINEAFLDTAVLRGNVISRAQEIGYVPRAWVAPVARVTLSLAFNIGEDPTPEVVIPKGTKFSTRINNVSFIFSTVEAIALENEDSSFSKVIDIYQGSFVDYAYTVDKSNPLQKFTIPNKNVDTRFLTVTVSPNSASNINEVYTLASDINLLTGDDKVYFLKETWDGFVQIEFGDGVLGKAIDNGNVVKLNYFLTQGPSANGARTFQPSDDFAGAITIGVGTVESAAGGSAEQSIDEIKFLAPKVYQSQERGVTENDYIALMKRDYPNIEDIAVWGGEDNKPYPYYGKVFMAIKPKSGIIFSNALKERIKNDVISKYNIVSIRPELVDPDYIFINLDIDLRYDTKKTGLSSGAILSLIKDTIETFFETKTTKFGQELSFSKLSATIDGASPAVIDNSTAVTLEKRFIPSTNRTNYAVYFSNPLIPGSLTTSEFLIQGNRYKLKDYPIAPGPHSNGIIRVVRTTTDGSVIVQNDNQGTIDYRTGEVNINDFAISSLDSDALGLIRIFAKPLISDNVVRDVEGDLNVYPNSRNQIIVLDTETFGYPVNVQVRSR